MTDPVAAAAASATHLAHVPRTNRCSDPRYQGLTYLDADNAIPAPKAPPGSNKPSGSTTAFDFLAAAAQAASAPPPTDPVPQTPTNEPPRSEARDAAGRSSDDTAAAGATAAGAGIVPSVGGGVVVSGLEDLDEKAAGEACTPAGAAQALARIACRLYDLADDLGGG